MLGSMYLTSCIKQVFRSIAWLGKQGWPKAPHTRAMAKSVLLKFFNDKEQDPTSSSLSKGLDLGLSFLCWGYWCKIVSWGGHEVHSVKALLDD